MKKLERNIAPGVIILLSLFLSPSASGEEERSKFFQLDNGLKIYLMEKSTVPLVNCVIAFDVGSKNESEAGSGLVHILEHYILFRGTKFRSGEEISREIRSHGGFFNAHTGRDLSLFEMILPAEHLEFGLSTQKEILFDLEFSQEQLDREKEVILEEFNQLQDDPIRLATSLVYQNLFPGHCYEYPIYGDKQTISSASIEQIKNFHQKYFVPENAAIAVVGNFSLEAAEQSVRSIFSTVPSSQFDPPRFEITEREEKKIEIEREMDINLSYLAIGIPAPDFNHRDQYSMDLLVEILGRGINPMLNHPLLQKRITINSMQMGYSAHKYGGAVVLLLSMEPKNLKRAKNELVRYLKSAHRLNFSSDDVFGDAQFYAMDYMESAKNRIKFNGELAEEKGLAIASSFARYMLMNELPERGRYLEQIEAIKSQDLRKAADRWISRKGYVVITINPENK